MPPWITSTLLFVRDVDKALAFYVDKLGFALNMRHEEDGRALVAGVSRGDGCAFLLTCQWPDRTGSAIVYNALDEAGFNALRLDLENKAVAVKDGWWGKQILIVEDDDGNQIFFPYP